MAWSGFASDSFRPLVSGEVVAPTGASDLCRFNLREYGNQVANVIAPRPMAAAPAQGSRKVVPCACKIIKVQGRVGSPVARVERAQVHARSSGAEWRGGGAPHREAEWRRAACSRAAICPMLIAPSRQCHRLRKRAPTTKPVAHQTSRRSRGQARRCLRSSSGHGAPTCRRRGERSLGSGRRCGRKRATRRHWSAQV